MSDPIKVFIVIGQLEVGGTEKHLLHIVPTLNVAPLRITIYALRGGGELERAFEAAGIRVVTPPHHSRRWVGLCRTAVHLLTTLRRERPQIVHYFLPEAYLIGGLCSLISPRCVRLMSRRSLNFYQQRRLVFRHIERFLHRRMNGVIANSQAVLAEIQQEGVAFEKCGVIYNGVPEPTPIAPESGVKLRGKLGIESSAVVFVMVANLIPYKGHDDLIEAFAIANSGLPRTWRLLLIGNDCGIQSKLERKSVKKGIASHIHWLGAQDKPDSFLAISDVALLASHEEGFSNSILEAMVAELPLIVTAVGGNSEAVLNGTTGIVVPARDPAGFAEALVRLAASQNLRRRLASAGKARASRHFTVSRVVSAYRRIYVSLGRGKQESINSLIVAQT